MEKNVKKKLIKNVHAVCGRYGYFLELPIWLPPNLLIPVIFIAISMCVLPRRKENQESVVKVLKEAQEVQEHQAVLVALAQ